MDYFSPNNQKAVALVTSPEPLLLRDFVDATKDEFRNHQFDDIQNFYIEQGFDWDEQSASESLSLFSQKILKIYNFYSSKPGVVGAKAIQELSESAHQENIILFVMPKLEGNSRNSAWLKKIKKLGQVIELKPVYNNQLPQWVSNRAQQKGLNLAMDAAHFIADSTEGNLLSADQELEKLTLLFDEGELLSLEKVTQSVANQARYTAFELVDSCLLGNVSKAVKIYKKQKAEGVADLAMMMPLKTALEVLSQLKALQHSPQALNQLWQKMRIWDAKKRLYQQAASRLNVSQIDFLLQQCALLDRLEKGQQRSHLYAQKLRPVATDIDRQEMLELVTNFSGLKQT